MFKVRRDDIVYVISGKDRGKKGKVLKVFPVAGRAIVEGINLAKKHKRRTQQDQKGGVVQIEKPLHISNLMVICQQCSRPTRVGFTVLKDGSKTRSCKKCKGAI